MYEDHTIDCRGARTRPSIIYDHTDYLGWAVFRLYYTVLPQYYSFLEFQTRRTPPRRV